MINAINYCSKQNISQEKAQNRQFRLILFLIYLLNDKNHYPDNQIAIDGQNNKSIDWERKNAKILSFTIVH